MYQSSTDRIGYELSSPDGIHDWRDGGLAYDPRMYQKIFGYVGSTTSTQWYKMERPGVVLENGHVTHVTWAVADVDKDTQIPAGSNHGSKVIVVPFDGVTFDADTGDASGGTTGAGGSSAGAGANGGSSGGVVGGSGGTGGLSNGVGGQAGSLGGTATGGSAGLSSGSPGSGGANGGAPSNGGTPAVTAGNTGIGDSAGNAAGRSADTASNDSSGCACTLGAASFNGYAAGGLALAVALFGGARRRRSRRSR